MSPNTPHLRSPDFLDALNKEDVAYVVDELIEMKTAAGRAEKDLPDLLRLRYLRNQR